MRLSYVGELGFEIHIPYAHCVSVYHKIVNAGRGFDLTLAGSRAMDSLSMEKGMRQTYLFIFVIIYFIHTICILRHFNPESTASFSLVWIRRNRLFKTDLNEVEKPLGKSEKYSFKMGGNSLQ